MRDYKALLEAGFYAQIEKLQENDHKGDWDSTDIGNVVSLLRDEVEELTQAVADKSYRDARREAADVANFAHMIIFVCNKHPREKS